MVTKPLVLPGDQHGEIARIHVLDPRIQAPAAVLGGKGSEKRAIAVDDFDTGARLLDRGDARLDRRLEPTLQGIDPEAGKKDERHKDEDRPS